MKCSFVKNVNLKKTPKAFKRGDPVPAGFIITDDPTKPGHYLVMGHNAAGDLLSIDGVANITVASSDATVMTVNAVGVGFDAVGVKVGTVTADIVATWKDSSIGPFSLSQSFSVTADPKVTGLVVTPV